MSHDLLPPCPIRGAAVARRIIKPVWTCGVPGHEHYTEDYAARCPQALEEKRLSNERRMRDHVDDLERARLINLELMTVQPCAHQFIEKGAPHNLDSIRIACTKCTLRSYITATTPPPWTFQFDGTELTVAGYDKEQNCWTLESKQLHPDVPGSPHRVTPVAGDDEARSNYGNIERQSGPPESPDNYFGRSFGDDHLEATLSHPQSTTGQHDWKIDRWGPGRRCTRCNEFSRAVTPPLSGCTQSTTEADIDSAHPRGSTSVERNGGEAVGD